MIYVCERGGSRAEDGVEPVSGNRRQETERQHKMAWHLAEYAIRQEYGIRRLADLELKRTKYGKPFGAAYPEIHFSLSHCERACAFVLSDSQVGIDVERLFAFRPSLAKKICTREEAEQLEALPEEARAVYLQLLWSIKESFVKRDGRGLGYGLERIGLVSCFEKTKQLCARIMEFRAGKQVQPEVFPLEGRVMDEDQQTGGLAPIEFLAGSGKDYTLAVCGSRLLGQIRVVGEAQLDGE